jgi:glycosyltransferase involved in cell wall biosynthesis
VPPDIARKRILVVGAYPPSLLNFRGPLVAALAAAGHDVVGMADGEAPAVAAQLEALGARYRPYPVRRTGLNPLAELRTLRALRMAVRELAPDLVLAYTIKPVVWGGLATRRAAGTRFIALIEGLGWSFQDGGVPRRALRALVTRLYRRALARADRVLFLNPDNRDEFVRLRIAPADRCAVVDGAGVDTDAFAPAPFPDGSIVFLTIARLLGDKGLREFADAARRVRARHPEAVFRLVGPTDDSPDAIPVAEVRGWEAAGVLEYAGAAADVRPFLAGCHVYVLASRHEGMPRTVLEAMAMGRPVLTTDAPGCRETVIPGENGFLLPPGDPAALAERMAWFIENRDRVATMGQRGRAMAVERFRIGTINERMMRLMELAG